MIEIINRLAPFFEDCYAEITVREYAKIVKVSPPTASKALQEYAKDNILLLRKDRGFHFYRMNQESKLAKDLSRIYWAERLNSLLDYLTTMYLPKAIILFGSLSKLETTKNSDIDIAVVTTLKKKADLQPFETALKRSISLQAYQSMDNINKELKANLYNAFILTGHIS